MRLYVLSEHAKTVEPVQDDTFAFVHHVWVKGRDWYDARHRALQHAHANGVDTIGILVGTCELYERPHWNGKGEPTKHHRLSGYQQNGLWLYMQRLARRFAHVYVPPLRAMRPWESQKRYPWLYENNPVPACCAMYRVNAVMQLRDKDGPWGQALCSNGFDSLTVSDYFFHNLADPVLDETGSAATWKRAYEHALHRHLEPAR